MIEHTTLITREATFHLCYSGKYSYLLGDSGSGKAYLVDLLGKVLRGYRAVMVGSRRIVGGPHGVAIDHVFDENVLLVFGEDYDAYNITRRWEKIGRSPNPCIFVSRDLIPAVPYSDGNVFTMQRIAEREFAMIPVPGGVQGAASLL